MDKTATKEQIMMFLSNAYIAKKLYEKYCFEIDKKYDLTISEGEVLSHICHRGGESTARNIVEHNWISKSQVSKSVEKLTNRGYLTAEVDENDRRFMRLHLTEAAEQPLKEIENATQKFLDKLFGGLDDGDLLELNRLLEKTTKNITGGI